MKQGYCSTVGLHSTNVFTNNSGMVLSFEAPKLSNRETDSERGMKKEREILGTVNQEGKGEVLSVMNKVRNTKNSNDARRLLDEVAKVYGTMNHHERAAVVNQMLEDLQTYSRPEEARTALIEWVMSHQVVDEEEEVDPTNPESPWMNNVHAAIADVLGAELNELEYYTAVDSPLDWKEGIDGFFIWRSPEGEKIMTFDFTTSVYKTNEKVDLIVYWSPVPVHPDERSESFFYLSGSEARGPQVGREVGRFNEALGRKGRTFSDLFKPIRLSSVDR